MRLRPRIFFSELPRAWLDTRSTRTRVATRRRLLLSWNSAAHDESSVLRAAHPTQKESVVALLSAGRSCLRKLKHPADALRNYKLANHLPHLDWETNLAAGMRDAEKACSPTLPWPLKQ
jgi:hypothetical protein